MDREDQTSDNQFYPKYHLRTSNNFYFGDGLMKETFQIQQEYASQCILIQRECPAGCIRIQQECPPGCIPIQQECPPGCIPIQQECPPGCILIQPESSPGCIPIQQEFQPECIPIQQDNHPECTPNNQEYQPRCINIQHASASACIPLKEKNQQEYISNQQEYNYGVIPFQTKFELGSIPIQTELKEEQVLIQTKIQGENLEHYFEKAEKKSKQEKNQATNNDSPGTYSHKKDSISTQSYNQKLSFVPTCASRNEMSSNILERDYLKESKENAAKTKKISSSNSPLISDQTKSSNTLNELSLTTQALNNELQVNYSNKIDSFLSKYVGQKDSSLNSTFDAKHEISLITSKSDYLNANKHISYIENKFLNSFSPLNVAKTKTSTTLNTLSMTNKAINNESKGLFSNKIDSILSKSVDQNDLSLSSTSDSKIAISSIVSKRDYFSASKDISEYLPSDPTYYTLSMTNQALNNNLQDFYSKKVDSISSKSFDQKGLPFVLTSDLKNEISSIVSKGNFFSASKDISKIKNEHSNSYSLLDPEFIKTSTTFNKLSLSNKAFNKNLQGLFSNKVNRISSTSVDKNDLLFLTKSDSRNDNSSIISNRDYISASEENSAIENEYTNSYSPFNVDRLNSSSTFNTLSLKNQATNNESKGLYSHKIYSLLYNSDDHKELSFVSASDSKNKITSLISNIDNLSASKENSASENEKNILYSRLDPAYSKTSTRFKAFSLKSQASNNKLLDLYSNNIDLVLSESVVQKDLSLISTSDSKCEISTINHNRDYFSALKEPSAIHYQFSSTYSQFDEDQMLNSSTLNTLSILNQSTNNESKRIFSPTYGETNYESQKIYPNKNDSIIPKSLDQKE